MKHFQSIKSTVTLFLIMQPDVLVLEQGRCVEGMLFEGETVLGAAGCSEPFLP